ncbi:hypothetical protein PIB30_093337 [Stylosanthes scabra]|uniref:Transposase n=1 Tax=Stylosanthes scabra TaxID=79078 RepID=A0ABU6VV34_9FABA|nr:hypothetical protein [Stylosanthes scabra]
MRAFVLYIQKCFLLPTSAANVTQRALPTIFDVENTRRRNWALHVHNFLLQEVKKAKLHNTKSINGCCYAMLIIYFHETHFGKNAKEPEVQPPWNRYWTGDTLWKRLKEETRHVAVSKSVKTRQMKDENDRFQKKNPKKNALSESESEYEESSSSDESYSESNSEETRSDELIQRKQNTKSNPTKDEKRSKKKHEINATEEMNEGNEPLHLSQILTHG